jgi:hypothetical protein
MNPSSGNRKHLLALVANLLLFVPTLLAAQSISPRNAVSLTGAVGSGQETTLIRITPTGRDLPFVVPPGKFLVLTDIVISPQVFPSSGQYLWDITSIPELTTAINVASSADSPSSFQVHLTTGMVFHSGSSVRFMLTFGNAPVNISALGYLAPVR